ncbi:multi-sensor signal transduction histidine kinase [Anaeromyxobacter dehalogenans 2CP-1]|uniref:histidine kinase n=1 Tax=Anaeromyxobacter dehalogenans (strain ATCC BAA-258 / DSM 21875 / 2CP-1) TaxID=455488 RepID=B8J659_ANAD2|nr:ATP-binding protein [Anaeromyxobacter dehalogenans]ACL66954.1 multi-sensor signal transduction histidine kinase [Anaeromyxobacter dehalogenans 2CP-1]
MVPPELHAGSGALEARPDSTVLVVDDDEHVRRALARVLRRSRCRVIDAGDASGALALLEREPVQVVVSDHRMPGTSGVELLRIVKERWPTVQRVLLTGHADSAVIEEAVNRSEIFRFIWKPWDDAHLRITVQSAVDQHWMLEENRRLEQLLAERNAQLERLNRDLDGQLAARSVALVRAAEEWRASFDAIGDPLAIFRGGGCEIARANAAFARAAGVAITQVAGLRCREHAFGVLPCPACCDLPRGGTAERELAFGDRTWMIRSFPFGDGGLVVTFKDVTDEREVSRRLFHAEKMSAVGQLAGGVAHEINNPLGGILAFAQLMSREERSPEDMESLRLIQDAANRAKRIVESLLRFSRRPREEERGPVDLRQVVDDALFLLSPQLRAGRFEVVRRFEPAVAIGNGNQLQQVVVNLLVNALQAMGDRGTVTVAVGPAAPGRLRLSVADTGPGVPEDAALRIFEPFFTTKPEGQGTGLGLSICYQIVEEHGGTIRLEQPGPHRGACFVLELPAAQPRHERGEAVP